MIDQKKEDEISKILKFCYVAKPSDRRLTFPVFIKYIFQFCYIDQTINYVDVAVDVNPNISTLRGVYKTAAIKFLDKNPSIKNLIDSSDYKWDFVCIFHLHDECPETIMIKTEYLSVFALIDPINFKSFWFNGNLELVHSFEELGSNLGIKIPHPIRSCRGFLSWFINPYSTHVFSQYRDE